MPMGISIALNIISAFIGIAFFASLITAINPRWTWRTFEKWKATEEPTDAYFKVRRIVGLVFAIITGAIWAVPTVVSWF
ncbi:hypothetical protein RFF05_01360 [Bengtsoniella intestinalis]|uniref:DUF6199 family natural product biosynthesis protein n=1 Tax=Bengtsoniella intestinalis TaxID=3073143 RepID=UPI00391F5F0D